MTNNIKTASLTPKRFHVIAVALIIIVTAGVYFNTLDNEFTNWDDGALILNNISIRSLSLENLKNIFSLKSGGTYQPMRVFSYAIDYSIGRHNTLVYHIHNTLLHILASILLYLLLLKILPAIERGKENARVFFLAKPDLFKVLALFSALVFALHPVSVEAVTWMSSRKTVLLSFFSFTSFLFYIKRPASRKRHVVCYLLSFVFWVFAAMSSPFGAALPALFVLFDYSSHPRKNPWYCLKDHFFRFLPYMVLGTLVLAYLLTTLGAGSRMASASTNIFVTMMQVFFDYMRNFTAPFWLNNRYVDYVYPTIFAYYKVWAGFCLLFGSVTVSAYLIIKNNDKLFFFVLFWFVIAWLPASNIVPISTRMADRYVYLASVGFFVFFSWALVYFFHFLTALIKASGHKEKLIVFTVMVVITGCLSLLSIIRNNVWQNSGTLWNNSLSRDPQNLIALNNYGLWLYRQGEVDKAKKYFLLASYVKRSEGMPLKNLGLLYMKQGELKKAEKAYNRILEYEPDSMLAHRMLWDILEKQGRGLEAEKHIDFVLSNDSQNPLALNQKGLILYKSGEYEQAQKLFQKAVEKFPNHPDLHFNLGMTLQEKGMLDRAFQSFKKAAQIKRDSAMAFDRMGQILYQKKDFKGAMEKYSKALNIHAGYAEIYCDIGNVYFARNDFDKADEYYKKSITLDKTIFEAVFNQCVIVKKTEAAQKAVECYSNCLEKFDNRPEVYNNLGSLMIEIKNYEKAEEYLLKAVALDDSFLKARSNLSLMYRKMNKPEKAFKHYLVFLHNSEKENRVDTLHEICAMLADAGNLAKAATCYESVLRKNPGSALDHFHLGIVLLRQGLEKKAGMHFKKALEIDPGNQYFRQFVKKE